MTRFLAVDGGQTGCRVAYVVDGETVTIGSGAGLSRTDASRTSVEVGAFEEAVRDMDAPPDAVNEISVGMTGFDGAPDAAFALADGLRSVVSASRVVLTNDAVTSYLGAVGFRSGAIVAAGTGIVALAGDEAGRFARADGWGYILGDDGGGYSIGRRGLASALRNTDGRGGSENLRRRATETYGTPDDIKRKIYRASNPASEVAKFAIEVAEAAREGDIESRRIWEEAASEAALTATAALGNVFDEDAPVVVSWAGSVFRARDLMLEPFGDRLRELRPATTLAEPEGDALLGAERLARASEIKMFAPLVHTFGA